MSTFLTCITPEEIEMAEKETSYSYCMVLVGGRFYACRVPQTDHYHRYTAHGAILVKSTTHEEIIKIANFGPNEFSGIDLGVLGESDFDLVQGGCVSRMTYAFDAFTMFCNKEKWEKVFAEKFPT